MKKNLHGSLSFDRKIENHVRDVIRGPHAERSA
jgi:hypothetical protein